MLAIDMILRAIIGTDDSIDQLLASARTGEYHFVIPEFALFAALCSVRQDDKINLSQFPELLRYSCIEPDNTREMGISGRDSWMPSDDEINRWRATALDET